MTIITLKLLLEHPSLCNALTPSVRPYHMLCPVTENSWRCKLVEGQGQPLNMIKIQTQNCFNSSTKSHRMFVSWNVGNVTCKKTKIKVTRPEWAELRQNMHRRTYAPPSDVNWSACMSFYRAMTLVQSAVLRPHVVRLSVCNVGGLWSHRLEILETNYTYTDIIPTPSLFAAKRWSNYSQGNLGKFGGDWRGVRKKWSAGDQKRQYLQDA